MGTLGGILDVFMRTRMIESENRAIETIRRLNESAANMDKFTEDGTPVTLIAADKVPKPEGVDNILVERKAVYGDYSNNARITQMIMNTLMEGENSKALTYMHKEGLHMIAHKMSRIVNGNPNVHDSWDDIIGYARCVVDRIPGRPVKS